MRNLRWWRFDFLMSTGISSDEKFLTEIAKEIETVFKAQSLEIYLGLRGERVTKLQESGITSPDEIAYELLKQWRSTEEGEATRWKHNLLDALTKVREFKYIVDKMRPKVNEQGT